MNLTYLIFNQNTETGQNKLPFNPKALLINLPGDSLAIHGNSHKPQRMCRLLAAAHGYAD